MDCDNIQELMSLYIDGELSEYEIDEFKEQLEECDAYKFEFYQLLDVVDNLKSLPQQELPKDFHTELIGKIKDISSIKDDKKTNKKSILQQFMKNNWKKISPIVIAACFTFIVLNIFNTNSNYKSQAKTDSIQNQSIAARYDLSGETSSVPIPQMDDLAKGNVSNLNELNQVESITLDTEISSESDKKIIRKARISIEVYDFDTTIESLKQIAKEYGGYIENSNSDIIYNDVENDIKLKSGSIVIRVPNQNYDNIFKYISEIGKVVGTYEEGEDITSSYIDVESILAAKQIEEQRLLELIEKANDINDLVLLEQRLTTVTGEIDSYNNKIKNWDRLIQFSTISVNIEQIKEQSKLDTISSNLSTRIKNGFISSINNIKRKSEDLIVWIAQIMPLIIIISLLFLLLYIIFLVIKIILKKFKNK